MSYPTKEQILSKDPKIESIIIKTTLLWKKEYLKAWNKLPNEEKLKRLQILIMWLYWANFKTHNFLNIRISNIYQYDHEKQKIYLDQSNPNVISSLHELAHHIFGPSELKACRWSIWIFKECFPKQYEKLTWDRHMLIK